MRDIIIIGAGGCAAEVTFYIEDFNENVKDEERINIVGYVDYAEKADDYYHKYDFKAPLLGDIDNFIPKPNQEVLIAIMNIKARLQKIAILKEKKAKIGSFIHHSVIYPKGMNLGEGVIIFPFCVIEKYSKIGDYNMLTTYSFISHDCVVGNNNFLSSAGLAGNVKVGNNNYFGIRSTVIPGIQIGNDNVIQSGMIVDKSVKDETTVFYRYKERVFAIPKEK